MRAWTIKRSSQLEQLIVHTVFVAKTDIQSRWLQLLLYLHLPQSVNRTHFVNASRMPHTWKVRVSFKMVVTRPLAADIWHYTSILIQFFILFLPCFQHIFSKFYIYIRGSSIAHLFYDQNLKNYLYWFFKFAHLKNYVLDAKKLSKITNFCTCHTHTHTHVSKLL